MNNINNMRLAFDSIAENEGFARVAVGSFFAQLNPTLEEVYDVKTAVSEAVTNAIIHGYNNEIHTVEVLCYIDKKEEKLEVQIKDNGCGIENVGQAMEPLFTTKAEEERAGMGFAFMEAFMDTIEVKSEVGVGTTVKMTKIVSKEGEENNQWIKQSL